jgi:hypothetical protein
VPVCSKSLFSQIIIVPSLMSTKECEFPVQISEIPPKDSDSFAGIRVCGVKQVSLSLVPRYPDVLYPHTTRDPSQTIARLWLPPQIRVWTPSCVSSLLNKQDLLIAGIHSKFTSWILTPPKNFPRSHENHCKINSACNLGDGAGAF